MMESIGNRLPVTGKFCLELAHEFAARVRKADISSTAGSLAFTTVLSLVPLLAVMFYVFKVFGVFEYAYNNTMPLLLDILSAAAGDSIALYLDTFIHQVHAKAVGIVGVAGLFVTATMTYFTVLKAFNRIWEVRTPPPLMKRLARVGLLFTVGPVLLVASVAVTTAVAAQVRNIPYSGQLVAYLLSTLLFAMVYGLLPMVKIPLRVLLVGSLIPAAIMETAKFGYAVYTSKMVSYSAFYGSFAAIPLFLLWIYIAWYITLLGAVWVQTLQSRAEK